MFICPCRGPASLGRRGLLATAGGGSGDAGRPATDRLIRNPSLGHALAAAMALGTVTFLAAEEAAAASKTVDTLVERPWAMLKQHAMGKS